MKDLRTLENIRAVHPTLGDSKGQKDFGFFVLLDGLRVIASTGAGWDHVSVSLPDRTPTWEEMQRVRKIFFEDRETVVQIHPPSDMHVNFMPHCLHLWRKLGAEHTLPPVWMIGPIA